MWSVLVVLPFGADIPVTFNNGDQFGARAKANSDVEVYKNGELLATRNVSSWQYYANDGYIGMWFINASDAILDNFGGGTFSTGDGLMSESSSLFGEDSPLVEVIQPPARSTRTPTAGLSKPRGGESSTGRAEFHTRGPGSTQGTVPHPCGRGKACRDGWRSSWRAVRASLPFPRNCPYLR